MTLKLITGTVPQDEKRDILQTLAKAYVHVFVSSVWYILRICWGSDSALFNVSIWRGECFVFTILICPFSRGYMSNCVVILQELLEWSQTQYDSVFSIFHDNIAGKSFQAVIGAPIPIDIVYTWVNGSDPVLLNQLSALKLSMNDANGQANSTNSEELFPHCPHPDCFALPCLVVHPHFGYDVTVETAKEEVEELSQLKWAKHVRVSKGFITHSRSNITLLR